MCWFGRLGHRHSPPPIPPYPTKPQQSYQVVVGTGGPPAMAVGPYAGVDSHLRGLAGAAEGFGHSAIGGLHGEIYCVTSLAGKSLSLSSSSLLTLIRVYLWHLLS